MCIDKSQKCAIEMSEELANQIVSDSELSEYFLNQISLNNKKYADIIRDVLHTHPKIYVLNVNTLRSAAQNVLRQLLSEDERQEVITNARKRGGSIAISSLQENLGVQGLSDQEKNIMDEIGKNPEFYKKKTVRDILKIQNKIFDKTGIIRNKGTIKKYMAQFKDDKREFISWLDYPKEVKDLEKLYKGYYIKGQKLPIKTIVEELNKIHNHNRTTDAVSIYIRVNWTSGEEKAARTSQLRSDEEKEFIRNILNDKGGYIKKEGRGKGGYDLSRIEKELKHEFPNSKRGIKGIKHQLDKQEKILTKQLKK